MSLLSTIISKSKLYNMLQICFKRMLILHLLILKMHIFQFQYTKVQENFIGEAIYIILHAYHLVCQVLQEYLQKSWNQCFWRSLGISCFYYIDDSLIQDLDSNNCRSNAEVLINTLKELGFHVNFEKSICPSQKIQYLGLIIRLSEVHLMRKLRGF